MINKAKVSVRFIYLYKYGQSLWADLIMEHFLWEKKKKKKKSH